MNLDEFTIVAVLVLLIVSAFFAFSKWRYRRNIERKLFERVYSLDTDFWLNQEYELKLWGEYMTTVFFPSSLLENGSKVTSIGVLDIHGDGIIFYGIRDYPISTLPNLADALRIKSL